MNPASLIPTPEPLLIPWVWFDILLIITFTAHILFMNALVGSAFIGMVRSFRGKERIAREVGKKLPPLLALTINMGVAPLLFLQVNYGQFDYVSSVLMGGWWLAVIAALMFSYYGFYIYKFKYESLGPSRRIVLFTASLAGLIYTGFMLTNNMSLMLVPDKWLEYFDGAIGFLNWHDPTLIPRIFHFMAGAIALGGLFIALLGRWKEYTEFIDIGMTWFTRATLFNIAIGVWFFISLPHAIILNFMGHNIPATLTMGTAILSAGIMLSAGFRKAPQQAAIWAVLTVFFMSCTRHWLRTFSLESWFRIEETPITNQYGSFYLFLGFAVVGSAIIAYMLKLYFKSCEGEA